MAYLEAVNLTKTFTTPGGREIRALSDVSFVLAKGQILSLVGDNGSGKTTLLNCLRKTILWDSGDLLVDGTSVEDHRNKAVVASVFQDVERGVVGTMTALDNLCLAFSKKPGFRFAFPNRKFGATVREFVREAGLTKRFALLLDVPVCELSGGQRQQVAILMAMMREPDILLLDEFVANLDSSVKQELLTWTRDWIREKRITTITVTHDHATSPQWGDCLLELRDGECIRFENTGGATH